MAGITTKTIWCGLCGCNADRACVCAKDCPEHIKKIAVPGALWCFLTGTSMFQGELYSHIPEVEAAAQGLKAALENGDWRKVGKGDSLVVRLNRRQAWVLWDYADSAVDGAYFGDGPTSETYAAKKVMARVEEAFGRPPDRWGL